MKQQPRSLSVHQCRRCAAFALALSALSGCASPRQDNPKAAESAKVAAPNEEPPSYSASPTSYDFESADSQPESPPAAAPPQPAVQQLQPGAAKSSVNSASRVGRETQSPRAAAPEKKGAASGALLGGTDDAERAYAEPAELTQALADFESGATQLSMNPACSDACRAFESMRRAASRICELVSDADPKLRCKTAQGRLEQASKDLVTRCPTCR